MIRAEAEITLTRVNDGQTGPQGIQGVPGPQGAQGPQGDAGAPGEDGTGITSAAVTYQAGTSQTSPPTGTWSSDVPELSADFPYLWTKTTLAYSDNTTSTSYSVSSTLESVEAEIADAAKTATNYIAFNPADGLKISGSNPDSATENYVQIKSDGIKMAKDENHYSKTTSSGTEIVQNGVQVASFGAETIIGDNNSSKIVINDSSETVYTKEGAEAFKTTSMSGLNEERRVTEHPRITISPGDSHTYTLRQTPVLGRPIFLYGKYAEEENMKVIATFAAGTSLTVNSPKIPLLSIAYNSTANTMTFVNNGNNEDGDIKIVRADYYKNVSRPATSMIGEIITSVLTGAVNENNPDWVLFDLLRALSLYDKVKDPDDGSMIYLKKVLVEILKLLKGPSNLDSSGLSVYGDRLENVMGGIYKSGKWRFIQISAHTKKPLSANNTWALFTGLKTADLPITNGAALSAVADEKYGNISAYVSNTGSIKIMTGGKDLVAGRTIAITGWYLAVL